MRKPGGSFVGLIAAIVLLAIVAPSAQGTPTTQASLLALVNSTRAQYGLSALKVSAALERSAALKAGEIRRCGNFSHTPCGASFTRTFQQVGYLRGRVAVGENLYWGQRSLGTPNAAVGAWLQSPPHRENLLGRGWRQMGVAIIHAPSLFGVGDVWLYVLQFGRRG
jgi:uncharacterized protein YkwD